jgi:hypothetical protein
MPGGRRGNSYIFKKASLRREPEPLSNQIDGFAFQLVVLKCFLTLKRFFDKLHVLEMTVFTGSYQAFREKSIPINMR